MTNMIALIEEKKKEFAKSNKDGKPKYLILSPIAHQLFMIQRKDMNAVRDGQFQYQDMDVCMRLGYETEFVDVV